MGLAPLAPAKLSSAAAIPAVQRRAARANGVARDRKGKSHGGKIA